MKRRRRQTVGPGASRQRQRDGRGAAQTIDEAIEQAVAGRTARASRRRRGRGRGTRRRGSATRRNRGDEDVGGSGVRRRRLISDNLSPIASKRNERVDVFAELSLGAVGLRIVLSAVADWAAGRPGRRGRPRSAG